MNGQLKIKLEWILILFVIGFCSIGSAKPLETNPTAFIHSTLLPMTDQTVFNDQTVIVQNGKIISIGPSKKEKLPPNAKVINCQHAFLMPGLADMHMHLRYDWLSDTWPVSPLNLYLANGVTTIRCFGPRGRTGRYGLTWRKEIDNGRLDGPYILTCGPQLRGHFKNDPEDNVIRQKYQNFDFIKIYSFVTTEEYYRILSMAKKLKIYTAGHIPFQLGLDQVLASGLNEIAHIEELLWEFSDLDRKLFFSSEAEWMNYAIQTTFNKFKPFMELSAIERDKMIDPMVAEVVNKLKRKPIPFCTTMVVDDIIVQKLFSPEQFLEKPENKYLPQKYIEQFRAGREKHQMQFKGGENFAFFKYMLDKKLLAALKKNKIPLLLSTDAGTGRMGIVPGFSIHDELRILVENGFTPYEALASGTIEASKIVEKMNGKNEFGTIEPGKRADFILLEKNPFNDIANTRKILGVMASGRWYDKKALTEMTD